MRIAPRICLLTNVAAIAFAVAARGQFFDFADGTDHGWFHYDPLAGFGLGGTGTWTFPEGAYRIQASASQAPFVVGPGRAGSLLAATNYSAFHLTTEVLAWDNSVDQLFGILARADNLGADTTTGYVFSYATRTGRADGGQIEIIQVTGERGRALAQVDYTLDPARHYRLEFTGQGGNLLGRVFDLSVPALPLATLSGSDLSYGSGAVGVFVFYNGPSGAGPADATFDNFRALLEPPPPLQVEIDVFGDLTVSWAAIDPAWTLEAASHLASSAWLLADTGILFQDGTHYRYLDSAAAERRFFRLRLAGSATSP